MQNLFKIIHLNGYYTVLNLNEDEHKWIKEGYEVIGYASSFDEQKRIIIKHANTMLKKYMQIIETQYKNKF